MTSMINSGTIKGSIKRKLSISGTLQKAETAGLSIYSGEYEVLPETEQQTLATSNKYLKEDVVIKSIPFYEVSNDHDGETIIIGGKI